MRIEILSVTMGEYDLIETNEPMKNYRRYSPELWEHELGVYGWHHIMDASLYEEAYQIWMRNAKQAKPPAKTNK